MYQPTILSSSSRSTILRSCPRDGLGSMKLRSHRSDAGSYSGHSEYPCRNAAKHWRSVSRSASEPRNRGFFWRKGLEDSRPATLSATAEKGFATIFRPVERAGLSDFETV